MRTRSKSRKSPTRAGQDTPAYAGLHSLLLGLSEAVASARPIEATLDDLLRGLAELAGTRNGFVAVLGNDDSSLSPKAALGCFDTTPRQRIALGDDLIGRMWASGESTLVQDYVCGPNRVAPAQLAGVHGLALTPVRLSGSVVGVIGLATVDVPLTDEPAMFELMETVAPMVAIALQASAGAPVPVAVPGPRSRSASRVAKRSTVDPVFDLIPEALWVKDRENRVLRANAAAARALNLPAEEIEGQFLWELDPENAASSYRHDLEAIELRAPLLGRLEEQTNAAGERRWWRVDRVPVLDEQGRVESLVVLARDVSEHHVSQARLEASRRAAERANRIKSHTLATLAQDVRSPLERVHCLADRLLATQPDERAATELVELRYAADTALAHVQDLLDFARVEAGNLPVESARFDLRSLVEDVLELCWQGARSRGIALAGHVDPSIPAILYGDLVRVRQVLVQVLAQALRAVRGGELVVSARTVMQSEQHWEVRLEVHASQWALLPQELETMFGPFLHGEDALDESPREGGVGLALAHRLVEMLGGRVGLRTASEGELSCWCTLLFERAESAELENPPQTLPRSGIRALVVESHASTARVLARQLQDLAVVVDVAAGGAVATAMMQQARQDGWAYDACFVGERLDDGDALAWIESLGDANERHERVILLVAFGRPWRGASRPGRGPDARLTQPVRGQLLAETLAALVGHEASSGSAPQFEGAFDDERNGSGTSVFVLETDPLQQRLVETALRRLGCDVESYSDPVSALDRLDRAHPGEFALALVDPRVRLDGKRALIESIRRLDRGKEHRPLYALIDRDDLALREESLAAGVDGVAGRPPRYEDLRRLLARHGDPSGAGAIRGQGSPATSRSPH